jgi:hypothetical protein
VNPLWYLRRLLLMPPEEIVGRVCDARLKRRWRQCHGKGPEPALVGRPRMRPAPLPGGCAARVPLLARRRLITAAEDVLRGAWPVFGVVRHDLADLPDWFADPQTRRRAPDAAYCFDINHRDEARVGNVKRVWELSRHHHLTVLAAAYWLTGEDRFATRIDRHLRDWWAKNPFLAGIHWTSGIEIGLRLIAWTWVRRLLDGWVGAAALFEDNPEFRRQLYWHQLYLAHLRSHGSSANNHLIAEVAGLFVSTSGFPLFRETADWRALAAAELAAELPRQTFANGFNRELATDYQGFVLELALAAALEGDAAAGAEGPDSRVGTPLDSAAWTTIERMTDALAAVLDERLNPPRQGDGDDGYGLVLDEPAFQRWNALLATGAALFGAPDWWPPFASDDVRTVAWTALARPGHASSDRPVRRPALFEGAGIAILHGRPDSSPSAEAAEDADAIWCRLDHGPHGFLTTAAHGHADALSVEVRCGGVEILVDPGTYCYHGEPEWRRYFRSTVGHNTLELAGRDQSSSGGPFMWTRHARTTLIDASGLEDGEEAVWSAMHDGYSRLRPPAIHRRRVTLDRRGRALKIIDRVECSGQHDARLAFHLGPTVECRLSDSVAELRWTAGDGAARTAALRLPRNLSWRVAIGETDPPLGWYSPHFGVRVPSPTLIGCGRVGLGVELVTTLQFAATQAAQSRPAAVGA